MITLGIVFYLWSQQYLQNFLYSYQHVGLFWMFRGKYVKLEALRGSFEHQTHNFPHCSDFFLHHFVPFLLQFMATMVIYVIQNLLEYSKTDAVVPQACNLHYKK